MSVNVVKSCIFDINRDVLPGLKLLLGPVYFSGQFGNLGLSRGNLFL